MRPLCSFTLSTSLFALCLTVATPALAQDSDADGTLDHIDAFPCDSSLVSASYAPAEGSFGLLMFEDFWNQGLDNDYNDAVISYQYALSHAPDGRVKELKATLQPLATGGQIDLGVALQLPVPAASVQQVSLRIDGGTAVVLTPWASENLLTITIADDLRAQLMNNPVGDRVLNAIAGGPAVTTRTAELIVQFATTVDLLAADAPYDLFVFRRDRPAHEIHQIGYCGTSRMDTSLFGAGIDGSNLAQGLCFTDEFALPSALNVPQNIAYPQEGADIAQLYPNILQWAASGGLIAPDWYTTAQPGLSYASAITPSSVSMSADTSCLPLTGCASLLSNGQTSDGVYTVDPDGAGPTGPTQVYCDMSTAGGGWSLALNLDTSDGHVMWWHNPLWTDGTLYGDSSPDLSGDYKGAPWNLTPAREVLLVVHEQGQYLGYKSFRGRNAFRTMQDWMSSGTNQPFTVGALDAWTSPSLWSGEHLVRQSNELWVNQNDAFAGYCNTQDWDRICSDTCKRGGNDGGGLGNCHDCSQAPNWRTTSEAQAGWHNWSSNSGCYPGTPHNGLGFFGSDTAYPATGANRNVRNNASWARPNGYAYDYAIFVRDVQESPARTCLEHRLRGASTDGMYTVDPDGIGPRAPISVYCDMSTDDGGWTLVQVGLNHGSPSLLTDTAVGTVSDPAQGVSAKLSRADMGYLLKAGERSMRYGRPYYGFLYVGPFQDSWIDGGLGSHGYGTQVLPGKVSITYGQVGTLATRLAWPLNGQPQACSNINGSTVECSSGLHLGTWSGQAADGAYMNGSPLLGGVHPGIDYELWIR